MRRLGAVLLIQFGIASMMPSKVQGVEHTPDPGRRVFPNVLPGKAFEASTRA